MQLIRKIFICLMFMVFTVNLQAADESTGYTMITSQEMRGSTETLQQGIQRVVGNITGNIIDYRTPEAEVLIQDLDITFIPYVVFANTIVDHDSFFQLAQSGMIAKKNGKYVIPDEMLRPSGIMFFDREKKPRQLDLFVMSQCPAGKDALRQMPAYKKSKGDSFDITCRYITNFREFGIDSLHGPSEIKDDIRQIIMQTYYPEMFWQYLNLYREGHTFEDICRTLGIDAAAFETRQNEAIALLEQDSNQARELSITASPTFVWENRTVIVGTDGFRRFLDMQIPDQSVTGVTTDRGETLSGVLDIVIFYGPRCQHCQWLLNTYVPKLQKEFGSLVRFSTYDISVKEYLQKKIMLEEEHGVIGSGVPAVFVAKKALIGRKEVEHDLHDIIKNLVSEMQGGKQVENIAVDRVVQGDDMLVERFQSFTLLPIIGAGLLDGINPCAFSTIIFFLSFLVLAGFNKKELFIVGSAFTCAVFITYFGLGLGAFKGLEQLYMFKFFARYFDRAVGVLAIILGCICLYDYITFKKKGSGEGMILQLPKFIKEKIHAVIRVVRENKSNGMPRLVSVAFAIGVLVSLLESVCTGQVYLPVLTLIVKMKVMWWRAVGLLFVYNFMFIVPLIIVFVLALFGLRSNWWAQMMQKHMGLIKILSAVLFFVFGCIMFVY